MVIGPDVREMRANDQDEVDALLCAAFPGPEEVALVRNLRADGAMVSERVMRWQDRIGAYAGISRMVAPEGWFALAPVAVLPEWQDGALGRDRPEMEPYVRFGTRIVRQTAQMFTEFSHLLRWTKGTGQTPTLVVLGNPRSTAALGSRWSGRRG